jgi:sugar/nucleoside kinase (ribokinase family)
MVNNILSRRREQGIQIKPMILWEPVPGVCSPEDWEECIQAMKVVDVISPNINEAAGFLGKEIDEEQPFLQFKIKVEEIAMEYVSHQIGENGTCVFRCGKHGCLVASRSMMKWLPAYHQSSERVVDPTGGGNAFCGGFCAGWVQSEGNFITAAMYGNIAASFAIEQYGLPKLESDKDGEKWNGDRIEQRRQEYEALQEDR